MRLRPGDLCYKCQKEPNEVIDGWTSGMCGRCNDRDAERYRERQEWDYYHNRED